MGCWGSWREFAAIRSLALAYPHSAVTIVDDKGSKLTWHGRPRGHCREFIARYIPVQLPDMGGIQKP